LLRKFPGKVLMTELDDQPIRAKSPSRLIHDKALERWHSEIQTSSPVPKKYPSLMVQTLAEVAHTSRYRMYRWLDDPDAYPLHWDELCKIAEELGGSLKVMFSVKCS
jgi:hypothetical protein